MCVRYVTMDFTSKTQQIVLRSLLFVHNTPQVVVRTVSVDIAW